MNDFILASSKIRNVKFVVLEGEVQELREQLQDRMQQIHDLQVHLARREEELTQAVTNIETEAATKVTFQRQIREFQTSIQDLQDDMESEKESRKRLEREKRELMEENESLRNELLDRKDINQVMLEREKKRDEEVCNIKTFIRTSSWRSRICYW